MKRHLFGRSIAEGSSRWPRAAAVLGVFGLTMVLGACSEEEGTLSPTIKILEPVSGSTVCGAPLRLRLEIENYDLEEPGANSEKAARLAPEHGDELSGHVDVYLDGVTVAMEGKTEIDISGVTEGEHQLTTELVDGEHQSLNPAVNDVVYFTVDSSTCSAE